MAGLDASTMQPLDGFDHVMQSIEKIFATPQGTRVLREWVGNPGLRLLGENATPRTILLWFNILWMLIELFEPRFRIRRFEVNSVDRLGYGDFTMVGDYRPYGHLDWVQAAAYVAVDNNGNVRLERAD